MAHGQAEGEREPIYLPESDWYYVPDWVDRLTRNSLADLGDEVARQDSIHRLGYSASRDDVRLALATIQDELDEALVAWREERGKEGWTETAEEILQAAAVALRLYRTIKAHPDATQVEVRRRGASS